MHPRDKTFPGEVFLRLAADALDWCGASRADPLALEGIRERFLPECTFRGRQNTKLQYATLVAAALRGGTDPDLLEEVAWWQIDDFCLPAGVAHAVDVTGRGQAGHLRPAGPAPGRGPYSADQVAQGLPGSCQRDLLSTFHICIIWNCLARS